MKDFKFLIALCLMMTLIVSCSSDDDNPEPINEEEVITTVRFILSPTGSGESVVLQSQDLDGDGPDAPVITITGTINANTEYVSDLQFINNVATPPEDVTLEIVEEADEHQIFYTIDGASNSSITYNDMDANGNPIGLKGVFNSGDSGTNNSITITLKHEPNKNAEGVSAGDSTNAGGETDAEVTFNYTVI